MRVGLRKLLVHAAALLEARAQEMAAPCAAGGQQFSCDTCPAGRDVCAREHSDIARTASALRKVVRHA